MFPTDFAVCLAHSRRSELKRFGRRRWDVDADVVCIGSGLGSIVAAIAAHDKGSRVVVLEKASKLGGVSGWSNGEIYHPCSREMRAAGIEDNEEDARRYFDFIACGFQEPELLDRLLSTRAEAIEYLSDRAGVKFHCVHGLSDYYYPDAPGARNTGRYLSLDLFDASQLGEWQEKTLISPHAARFLHEDIYRFGGLANVTKWDYELLGKRVEDDIRTLGGALMGYLVKAAMVDRGIPAHLGTPAQELITDDDGAVIGVRAVCDGKDLRVRARKGVVLATGGYDHNEELAKRYENTRAWKSTCPPYVHGDHLVMAGEIGAAVANVPPTNLAMFLGYQIPGEEFDDQPLYRTCWEAGCPHAIAVNRAGERFCDESFYKDIQPRQRQWDGHTQTQPNTPAFLIFDAQYRERYPIGPLMPGQDLPEALAERADTPAELAVKLGIDPAGLEKTLEHFNPNAEKGLDPDFDRGHYPWSVRLVGDDRYPNPSLAPVSRSPFYGIELVPVGVGINSHGLRFDTEGRVVHVRGHAIPGLYAAGNSAALLDLGGGYQSGTSNLRAITWGYIAGQHAASRA